MGPPRVVAMLPAGPHHRALHRVQSEPPREMSAPCCTPPRRQHGHFFCPRNRQLADDEMPTADTVRRTRNLFESRSPVRRIWTDSGSVSSGVSSADLSSPACKTDDSLVSSDSDWDEDVEDEILSDFEQTSCPPRYIPAVVMDRIRARGSTTTYFGGKIIARTVQQQSPTRLILTEIQKSTEYQAWLNPGSGLPKKDFTKVRSKNNLNNGRCRLIKSNSCDSRLEVMDLTQSQNSSQDEGEEEIQEQVTDHYEGSTQSAVGERWLDWPGKTSILFDFCSNKPQPSTLQPHDFTTGSHKRHYLSGAVASAHARLAASSTTTL